MYIPVWLMFILLTPLALYAGYVLLLLATLVGMHIILGTSKLGETLNAGLSAGLVIILSPFRHIGPWFDYAAVARPAGCPRRCRRPAGLIRAACHSAWGMQREALILARGLSLCQLRQQFSPRSVHQRCQCIR